jgi:hypothetical protein
MRRKVWQIHADGANGSGEFLDDRRNFACGVLAMVVSPFAVGFENLRESFDVS